jgi:hypothetical protein
MCTNSMIVDQSENGGKLVKSCNRKFVSPCALHFRQKNKYNDFFLLSIEFFFFFEILIMSSKDKCKKCDKQYKNKDKWCKLCQINDLKKDFTNSGIEKIDNLVQEIQSRIGKPNNIIFEWIPYEQFKNIKEVDKDVKIFSAIWKDGPLYYKSRTVFSKNKYVRSQNKQVTLKHLYNTRKITNVFLNEVRNF